MRLTRRAHLYPWVALTFRMHAIHMIDNILHPGHAPAAEPTRQRKVIQSFLVRPYSGIYFWTLFYWFLDTTSRLDNVPDDSKYSWLHADLSGDLLTLWSFGSWGAQKAKKYCPEPSVQKKPVILIV